MVHHLETKVAELMASMALSTGLPGLDFILGGLIAGDNVVWQVDSTDHYSPFLRPYCDAGRQAGRRVIYFRFARHGALVGEDWGVETHDLHPEAGFEQFISSIHQVIEEVGRGAFYVFDCLSDLAADWYSDEMLSNFFQLTCPYLFDLETIAYFALLRNYHSEHAVAPITNTTQLLLNVHSHRERLYVHPKKVQQRYSPTMYMLHAWEGDTFRPVTESYTIAEILARPSEVARGSALTRQDLWSRTFAEAYSLATRSEQERDADAEAGMRRRLLRMAVSRDREVLDLAERYLSLSDVLNIHRRMIGTGLIGGKSVGMLLARAILGDSDPKWRDLLEPHDSFFVASDVFYTYLVRNGCWWIRQSQRDPNRFLEGAGQARQRILRGSFPDHIVREFEEMLSYFGQSPIIVRSSSLLEDNFGNCFAGKYDSVFCANQGSHEKRLDDFLSAVRTVYASAMSENALRYRARRGILDRDEQMSLLIQRVSGSLHGNYHYPQIAGVGFSYNPYVWSEHIDPQAGLVRLVFGLGTRAVDRSDDDYTRVVALNEPELRPESNIDEVRQFAQHKVDVLDLEANQLVTRDFTQVARQSPELPLSVFASSDTELLRRARELGKSDAFPWVLTFSGLLNETSFVENMRELLALLQGAYNHPVDIEFAANLTADSSYVLNLVQCRPLQVESNSTITEPPADIPEERVVIRSQGAVIGQSRLNRISRLIYVIPSVYGQLPLGERYSIARLIGRLTHLPLDAREPGALMLLGPGRWGTSTPSLGVPVSFAEISPASILCEIVSMREELVPDVSLGTHFFSELVEMDMLYLALFPNRSTTVLNDDFLMGSPNILPRLIPDAAHYCESVRVIDADRLPDNLSLQLHADTLKQRVVCYLGAQP